MTLEATVLGDDAVRRTSEGYEVDLHLAWYRSLPLSCVEDIRVSVAGKAASREDLRVLRDGRKLSLDDLADLVDEEWFVQDALTVVVPVEAPLKSGSEALVDVMTATRVPYILVGPDKALTKPTRVVRKVVIQ